MDNTEQTNKILEGNGGTGLTLIPLLIFNNRKLIKSRPVTLKEHHTILKIDRNFPNFSIRAAKKDEEGGGGGGKIRKQRNKKSL